MNWLRKFADHLLELTRGRTTAFFLMFFFAGHVMAFVGKLDANYIAFVGVLGGLVLGHSVQENKFGKTGTPPPGAPPPEGGA